jgi:RimJ/RimL family protein N-acetyltransferase
MFKKILMSALGILSTNSIYAATVVDTVAEPRTTFSYADPTAKKGLTVSFEIPAAMEVVATAAGEPKTYHYPALEMRSVTRADVPDIARLFGNPTVMKYYMDGNPRPPERIQSVFESGWGPELAAGNPWVVYPVRNISAFTLADGSSVFPDTFLGFVGMAVDDGVGCSLFFGMGDPKFWNNRLASHVTAAVLGAFVPALVDNGFHIIKGAVSEPFTHVVAYAHVDHAHSRAILSKYATPTDTVANLGGGVTQPRKQYTISVEGLVAARDANRAGAAAGATA